MENVPLRYSDELSDEQDNSKEQYQPAKGEPSAKLHMEDNLNSW